MWDQLYYIKQWHLVQFEPNSQSLAVRNLQRQSFETFLPLQEIILPNVSRFTVNLMLRCDEEGKLMPPKAKNTKESVEPISGLFTNFVATVEKIDE